MIFDKPGLIDLHQSEFEKWENLLASMSSAQLAEPLLSNGLSIKDTLAHLRAWQERTVARLEAALYDHEPRFPHWAVELDKDESPEYVDRANAWLLETHRHDTWPEVYQGWRKGYLRFLELLRAIPDAYLHPEGKLAWLTEYPQLEGYPDAYDVHHAEHRVELEDVIHKRGSTQV